MRAVHEFGSKEAAPRVSIDNPNLHAQRPGGGGVTLAAAQQWPPALRRSLFELRRLFDAEQGAAPWPN